MDKHSGSRASEMLGNFASFMRKRMFRILSAGPIPNHFAFIMDGNRRYAKKENLEEGAGHKAGFSALMSMLNYCYELGVKYVSIYAFSIDNFKRRPEEVQKLMDLMMEKIEGLLKEESVVNQYGIRVYFIGNLNLLSEPIKTAAENVMKATASNTKCALLICIAYTSSDEITYAVQQSCKDKCMEIQPFNSHRACNGGIELGEDSKNGIIMHGVLEPCKDGKYAYPRTSCNGVTKGVEVTENKKGVDVCPVQGSCEDKYDEAQAPKASIISNGVIPAEQSEKMQETCSNIKLVDIEKHMYMAVAPDPDILIRSSGETRLSNFLLWQTSNCPLYSPAALWPEIGLWHLVWAVLNFQRNHSYLEKKKKQL